ncbi:TPA: phage tail protein [Neisseria gonorrhoeae]
MGGKSSTVTSAEERILSLQVQRSSQGLTLPVIYGRTRVAGNLIWYGDFVTIEHKTTTRRGGKGGGGVKQVGISYTYEAAVMLALCEGEIQGVGRVWRDKEKFDSPAQLRLTLMRGGDEQPLWTHLQQAKHQGQALNYSGTAYLCSPNYELTKSAQIYQHNFEVIGKSGYSGNIPDANPREIVLDLLTNQRYGCGFPSQNIGDTDRYSNYCRAVGIFLSPAYTEQGEAQRNISELLEQTNSAAVFSQGRLKIIPYGDGSHSGNGAVYVADNKAAYDLTDDDFIVSGAQDPVKAGRKTNADAFNQIQVEYLDRDNDYNVAIAEAKDQANIEQYGLRPKDAVRMHGICDAKVAQKVAQQLLQRALYVRNEYEFKLGWKYCLLEPMDIVTLTDAGLGLNKTPVRITEIEEDGEGVLSVKAEDCPAADANKAYDGAETFITIAKCGGKPLEKGKTYYLRAAGYDSFGKDNLKISGSISFTVYDVSATDLSESSLNQALRDKINLIDGNGAGSVNERVEAVRSTADGNAAAVQTHARSINGLEAQYTVKVDANGKVAGFGLATTPKNGTPESKFIVNADRFGIGAAGKADVFPFVVDTQKNRVGINGELVVNGKAVVDKLNAGDIHGGKIAADTLDANRLKAGSVTAREIGAAAVTADKIGANAVTADKIQVADLSAVSSNLGSITGGSLNIGGGNFTVSSDGILTADNAVIRGRIEADSGYFNGTVRASSVEGDVLRAHRLRWTEGNVWVLDLDKDPLPRVLIPNFYVVSETFGNNRVQAKLLLNGGVLAPREVRETENYTNYIWRGRTFGRYEDLPPRARGGGDYTEQSGSRYRTRLEYQIQVIPAGKPVSLKLSLASHESVFSPFVSVSYLAQSDYEYKQLLGRMVWRTFAESFRYDSKKQIYLGGDRRVHDYQNQMYKHWNAYGGLLQLPDDIYGISFEYRPFTNADWSTMLAFDRSDKFVVVKKYRGHAPQQYSLFQEEFNTAVPKSNLLFFVEHWWQYIELRNIRVLIPESRENEVWQVG